VRVGVVGHRSLSADHASFAEHVCCRLFADLLHRGLRVTALSALAEGADTVFASAAVVCGAPLEVVEPHGQYRDDFTTRQAQADFALMRAAAGHRTLMPYPRRSDGAYQAAMRWVADRSDLLVAVWDGRPSDRVGGTAETIGYARALNRSILHVHAQSERVVFV
jgi:hypothetical protein